MSQPTPESTSRAAMLRRVLHHMFFHNLGYKLLALLLAILLWGMFITQDPSVTRTKVFRNVEISYQSSTAALMQRGFIVTSDIAECLENVTVEAEVPQLEYSAAQAHHYDLRVDLSGVKSPGEHRVPIVSTPDSTYGSVVSITPSYITVYV